MYICLRYFTEILKSVNLGLDLDLLFNSFLFAMENLT